MTELGKLGISAGELDDGIWVDGVDPHNISLRPTTIECHNVRARAVVVGVVVVVVVVVVVDPHNISLRPTTVECHNVSARAVVVAPALLLLSYFMSRIFFLGPPHRDVFSFFFSFYLILCLVFLF